MNRILVPTMCLVFAGCATTSVDSVNSPALQNLAAPTDATAQPAVANVKEVEIRTFPEDTVCRREYPTGSRIHVTRCYPRYEADNAGQAMANEVTRQEVELMRQQQMYYEQMRLSRQQAMRQPAPQTTP